MSNVTIRVFQSDSGLMGRLFATSRCSICDARYDRGKCPDLVLSVNREDWSEHKVYAHSWCLDFHEAEILLQPSKEALLQGVDIILSEADEKILSERFFI